MRKTVTGSRRLETFLAGVGAGIGKSGHDFLDVRLDVLGGVLKIVIHHIFGIEAEVVSRLRLLGVVNHEELIGAVGGAQLDAVGAQSVLDPKLGGVGMSGAFENGGGADLKGGAGRGDDQRDVAVAVVQDLSDAVVTRYWMPSSWPYFWIMVLMTSLAVPAVL